MRLGHREGATSSGPDLEFLKRTCHQSKERTCRATIDCACLKRIGTETLNEAASFEGDRQEQHCSMPTGPSWSSSWKEMKKSMCLRVYAPFEARADTWMASFLSDCSTMTARSASSRAALAGRLQSWRPHSNFRDASFWDKHRIGRIYKSALSTENTLSSKTRDTGRDRRRHADKAAGHGGAKDGLNALRQPKRSRSTPFGL